ncbi:response regulator transcription factor [uncultured Parasutterella sp.]|uniref:response regulator n=1 Tax=uncultured Parasutterella sp. TaxID=1263098 RepID=UPI002598E112|nr:response regulator transcription factor [uncultured Parasutterella sp.]
MIQPQTILLVDDHSLITTALSALLKSMYLGVSIHVGATAKEALELASKYGDSADLMILDLGLPDSTGTDLLERLLLEYPALKILVLSGLVDSDSILKTLSAGAAGFIPKSLDANLLKGAVNFVLEGGVYIPSKILTQQQSIGMSPQQPLVNPSSTVHLTTRQCQVLKLLSQGDSIKSICRKLDLSEGTIKTHVTAIYRAFDARNRTEALIAARRNGFNVD